VRDNEKLVASGGADLPCATLAAFLPALRNRKVLRPNRFWAYQTSRRILGIRFPPEWQVFVRPLL
jgi:hypothetical protein